MIPKKKARGAVKKRIDSEVQAYLERADEEHRKIYHSLDIHWIPDFEQRIFKAFDLSPEEPHFLYFDSKGVLQGKYQGFSEIQRVHFLWRFHRK